MVPNWITIWLDLTYDTSATTTGSVATHLCLCKTDPYLLTFRSSDKCIDYITDLQDDDKVILLISNDTSVHTLLQQSEELPQVDSVYILSSNKTFETSTKIRGIYTNLESLCAHLWQLSNIKRYRRESSLDSDFTISSLSPIPDAYTTPFVTTTSQLHFSPSSNDSTTKRQEAEFMYAGFLRDILVDLKSTKEEMIEFCRQKCADNQADLNVIDEFEDYYDAIHVIFWYTRDTFLYRHLNKALREQDVDTLYSLRCFIKDLHLQLKERHVEQQQKSTAPIDAIHQTVETVYRGQLMTNEEFDKKIRHNDGGFFSVSNFLSTTADKNLASVYAGNRSSSQTSEEQSVLFQIEIDKALNKFPYAFISKESQFGDAEKEILFTMGAVFRIQSVNSSNEGYWDVHLKLSGDEDQKLRILTEHLRKEIESFDSLSRLGRLMYEIANYEKAEQYHLLELQDPSVINDFSCLSNIHNQLGCIYQFMNQPAKATEHLEKSLEIDRQHLPEADSAGTYNNLGSIYDDQGDYEKALLYYNKALGTELNAPNSDQIRMANYYNNIGLVYHGLQRYSEALEMLEKSLQIQQKILPPNHPSLARSYNNISLVYNKQGNTNQAIEFLNKALEVQINSLPPNHPDLGTAYTNMGLVLNDQGKQKEALEMHEKALEIWLKVHPINQSKIAICYNNISKVYFAQRDNGKAIEYLNKALEIQVKFLPSYHLTLAITYSNLAFALKEQGKLSEALEMHEKCLQIRLKALPPNHRQIAEVYHGISLVYRSLCDYDKELEYLNKTLEIKQKLLPANDPSLATTYRHISEVYLVQEDNEKAVEYLTKTLQIELYSLSPDDPSLAITYNNLGSALKEQGKEKEALHMFEKCLAIQMKVLLSDHPDIATTYHHISQIYLQQGNNDVAIEYLNKTLTIQLISLPPDESSLATIYHDISRAYNALENYEKEIEYLNKALEIELISLPANDPSLATTYYNLSEAYNELENYDKVVEYLNKTLEIELSSVHATDNPSLATTYNNLALAFNAQGKIEDALHNMTKAYELGSKNLPAEHPDIIEYLEWIADVEKQLAEAEVEENN
ncbi:unnamed protein product [Didymodactylos carnosus]|uniref:Uncharacterized protein n=1 Tax=Didymodactylos carnosus TaxID=1234261 RepID=A0A813TVG7_9BILA|nr:unnamed protein product [Didymodactylos carnosus]CAF0893856.1 unnamed protein product [Didymodactylos carnosus]CAF3600747.1 unnamed protein product [Didymodactylos carnosus]CAF3675658.1 unnamed protein product [Didymodactylos carnosus]